MIFVDDEPVVCEECGALICAPAYYIHWDGADYCNEDCFKNALYRKFEKESEERYLSSRDDKEAEYYDMMDDD